MATRIKNVAKTKAQLDTAASQNGLLQGELYLETTNSRLAIGTGTNSYKTAMPSRSTAQSGNLSKFDANGDVIDAGVAVDDDAQVATSKIWTSQKTKQYVDSMAATGSSAIHTPVADLTAARALTTLADKMLLNIENLGLYRYDAESTSTDDGSLVIKPTNMSGRLLKMNSTLSSHNSLDNIQGGSSGERYHLTEAEYLNATRAASSTNGGYLSSADWIAFNAKANGTHSHNKADITDFDTAVSGIINGYTIQCGF